MKAYKFPFYILIHPIEGYEELRHQKKASLLISFIILFALFFTAIFKTQLTGFTFNMQRPGNLNILLVFARTILLFVLWVLSNLAFSELMDGEGKFKQVWNYCSYALVPYIVTSLVVIFLSNLMTFEEGVFLTWFLLLGQLWTGLLIFTAVMVAHQYTYSKTISLLILTVLGILIILFLLLLLSSLFQQVLVFFKTIYTEIMFRI